MIQTTRSGFAKRVAWDTAPQAPNAAVVDRGSRELNSSDVIRRIDSLEASAKVARRATGVNLRLEDPELKTRCEGLRRGERGRAPRRRRNGTRRSEDST